MKDKFYMNESGDVKSGDEWANELDSGNIDNFDDLEPVTFCKDQCEWVKI